MKYLGLFLLAIWLLLQGAGYLLKITFPLEGKILPGVNIAAGILLLLTILKIKHGNIGILFLGFWSVLNSSLFLFNITFNYSNIIVHVCGIVAGVLLIFKI